MRRLALLCGIAACGSDAAEPADAYVPPVIQYDYAGTYAMAGSWDLSAPFGGDGLGGLVADLMIQQIVEAAGVPSGLEDEATDAIAGQVRQPIVDYVNATIPQEVVTSSPTMRALDTIFSNIAVGGRLALVAAPDPDSLSGTDTVASIEATYQTTVVTVSMPELLDGAVDVAGTFGGGAFGADVISIGQHPLEIRFGMLVAIVAREALGVDVFALGDQALAAISCTDLVAEITGGGSAYSITVGGMTFSVPASTLVTACGEQKASLADAALGIVAREAGVRLGGSARLAGAGGVAATVTSEPGYGGAITSLPLPVEPQVSASFTATR